MLNIKYEVVRTDEEEGRMQAAITHRNPHFSLIGFHPRPLASRLPYQGQAPSAPQPRRKYFMFEGLGPIILKPPTHAPRCSRALKDEVSPSKGSDFIEIGLLYALTEDLHGFFGLTFAHV